MKLAHVRSSNLELYRIICMLMIVCHHYVVNSGLTIAGGEMANNPFSANSLYLYLFGMWGKTGINCFVMITGYFMCKSQITIRKFLKLILQVYFYNIIITLIFFIAGRKYLSVETLYWSILPFRNFSENFISGYIGLFLLIPFLNILLNQLNVRQHALVCLFGIGLYTILPLVPLVGVNMNYVSWFAVIYIIAAFIRLHPDAIYKQSNTSVWGIATLVTVLLAMGSVVAVCYINAKFGKSILPYRFVENSNQIFALLVGITSFMWFKNIKLGYSKFINTVGSVTFGVLLIHANSDAMRQWLWKDTVDPLGHYESPYLYAPVVAISIFIICIIIDLVRIRTIEKWIFRLIDKKLSK